MQCDCGDGQATNEIVLFAFRGRRAIDMVDMVEPVDVDVVRWFSKSIGRY